MKRRAFTLIEILIVMVIITGVSGALGLLTSKSYEWFGALGWLSSTKAETNAAAERVFQLAAAHPPYHIDPDNHGLSFSDGSKVRWEGDRLLLRRAGHTDPLLHEGVVRDFTAVRRGTVLTLNLTIEAATRPQGRPIRTHEIFEYPRVGLP